MMMLQILHLPDCPALKRFDPYFSTHRNSLND